MKIFNNYANYYDALYQDKDYSAECDFLEKMFRRYSLRKVSCILDLGCGTGGHALLLAKRGYKVEGIDFSQQMLQIARQKAQKAGLKINFKRADIRNFNLNKKFDAAIATFAVMGYQTTNRDFADTLLNVRRHLKQNGIFIFDVWFGPAVLTQGPQKKIKIVRVDGSKIIRNTYPSVDIMRNSVRVTFSTRRIRGNKILNSTKETHLMRYFFPQEIRYFMDNTGFVIKEILPFMKQKKKLSINDWNVSIIASAR